MWVAWEWLVENADAVTAAVAVLGLLVASILAWEGIRVARQSSRNDRAERLASYFSDLLDRVIEYQHPALLPYWQEDPVPPASAEARELHRAVTQAESSLKLASLVELRAIEADICIVRAALWPLYEFANHKVKRVQVTSFERSWRDVEDVFSIRLERLLGGRGGIAPNIDRIKKQVRERYAGDEVVRMQLADAVLDVAVNDLALAFRDRLHALAAEPPGGVGEVRHHRETAEMSTHPRSRDARPAGR